MPRLNNHNQPIGQDVDWAGARAPEPITHHGRYCTLVPLATAHFEDLAANMGRLEDDPIWTYLPFGRQTSAQDFETTIFNALPPDQNQHFAIISPTGEALGNACFLRIAPAAGTIEVGCIMYSSKLQRTVAATEAMFLMMKHVFEDLGYRRYEWKCDALNQPSFNAAQRLGFTYEGTFRQAMTYKGRNRDTAWLSIMDHEWPALRSAFESWLAPGNFDENGQQIKPLGYFRSSA